MSSSSDKGELPLDKAAAARRVNAALAVVMSNKCSPAAEAALAAAVSALKAARKNAARTEATAAIEKSAGAVPADNNDSSAPTPATTADAVARDQRLKKQREKDAASLQQWLKKEEKKKFRRVRLTKEGVDQILSVKSKPIPKFPPEFLLHDKRILDCYSVPPEQLLEYFDKADAVFHGADNHFLEMQKRIREEYQNKGYADYWVTDDEDGAPRPARRRVRPGVMKHKGGTKKLS